MLQVNSLTKTFRLARKKRAREQSLDPRQKGRRFHAIAGIDLGVRRGQMLGLLGPNGAGKTTLLRILSTSLKPTSGVVLCDGEDLTKNPLEIRKRIGFVSGNTGLYGRLTAREMLRYYGKLHGMAACKSEGQTVLFSTHHMDEVDQLCDSVVVIHEGKLCFEGSVDAMRSQTGESFLDKAFLKLIKPKTEETTQ